MSVSADLRVIDGASFGTQRALSANPVSLDRFRDRRSGYVSLGLVRTYLDLQNPAELGSLMDSYSEWLLDDLGLVFKNTVARWDQRPDWTGEPHFTYTESFRYSKARKRGNDMDAYRIQRRMKGLRDAILPYCESEDHLKATRALYTTLTLDPELCEGDVEAAWLNLGRCFNNFLSRLRRSLGTFEAYGAKVARIPAAYGYVSEDGRWTRDPLMYYAPEPSYPLPADVHMGEAFASKFTPCRIHVLRSWESHESGRPHVHAILCFEDARFGIFQDSKFRWRAKRKNLLEKAWPYGWVDAIALTPGTLERELDNVLWYVAKNLSRMDYRLVRSWPRKKRLTESILWYLGSRSFSVSKRLLGISLDAEPADLIQRASIIQNRLDGEGFAAEMTRWDFLGLIPRTATELERDDWEKEYSEPPPWAERWLEPESSQRKRNYHPPWAGGT